MSDTVIRVENLGKKYAIGRQKQRGYTTLREKLTEGAKSVSRRLLTHHGKSVSNPAYEEFWALKDVSFEIKQGDRVGIVGRNGSGKSTLLKILSRITEPSTGRISIKGRVASLLEVGTGFHPELTGCENVYLNGAILGMSKVEIRKKFDEIVAFAEVEKFLDTPVKRYSSGMYVRLAFAVAAHLEPEILIVDEVLAVGDVQFQKKCIGKMEEVGKEGRTVLFVSHNLWTVQTFCTRGILLNWGTVIADGIVPIAVSAYLRTLEQTSSQTLLERTERRGKGQVRFIQIDISAGRGASSKTLMTGYPALFTFHTTTVCPGLSCSFTIYNQYAQPVTYFDSAIPSQEDLTVLEEEAKFFCEINELLLLPGHYRINAALTCYGELQDHLEAAAIFDVEQGQLRGRLVSRVTGYGDVLIQHKWIKPT